MAAPPPVFLDLFNDPKKWDEPVPDYGALITLLGGVASTATSAPRWLVMEQYGMILITDHGCVFMSKEEMNGQIRPCFLVP